MISPSLLKLSLGSLVMCGLGWTTAHFASAGRGGAPAPGAPPPAVAPAGAAAVEKIDLRAELDAIQKVPELVDRRLAALSLLGQASVSDLRGILDAKPQDSTMRSAAMQRWAELDPRGAFEYYTGLPELGRERLESYHNVASVIFREWARQDPEAALRAAKTVAQREGLADARWEVISVLMEKDMEKGLAMVADNPNVTADHNRITAEIWNDDPGRFVKACAQLTSHRVENKMLNYARTEAMRAWVDRDLPGALAFVKTLPVEDAKEVAPDMIGHLAINSQENANAAWEALPASEAKEKAGVKLVRWWASRDPAAALAWLNTHMASGKNEAYGTLMETCAGRGLESARSLIDAIPPGSGRDHAVSALAQAWADNDDGKQAPAAAEWLLGLPPDKNRKEALSSIGSAWAAADLAGVAKFVQGADAAQLPSSLVWCVAQEFVAQAPTQALAWALSLPADRSSDAVDCVISQAGRKNLERGLSMLSGLKPGPVRESALASLVSSASFRSDEGALDELAAALTRQSLAGEATKLLAKEDRFFMSEKDKKALQQKLASPAGK